MRGRTIVAGLLLAVVTSGCGKGAPPAPATLTGVITEIAGGGDSVTGFDLKAGGESYQILIDPERDYGFDLTHLYDHQSTGDPVRVRLRAEEEALYALRIDDA